MNKHLTKTRIAATLAVVMIVTLVASSFAKGDYTTPTFTDLPKSHWAYTYVENAVGEGWISGMGDGTFNPEGNVTFAQFASMMTRAFYQDKLNAYNGATDPWWMPYCTVAKNEGLFYQTYPDSNYSENATRCDMAWIIYNAMLDLGAKMPTEQEIEAAKASTPDTYNILLHNATALYSVKAAGIITGYDEKGSYRPFLTMTRAQAAVVLTKLDNYLKSNGATTDPGTTDPKPNDPVTPVTPSSGVYTTTANDVNSVKPYVGKSDYYPTVGRAAVTNRNGYHTVADVDIGNAQLVYELLDLVNQARRAEGLSDVKWTTLDSFEEYALLRAKELNTFYSHSRPGDQESVVLNEIIAGNYRTPVDVLNGWLNSPGHRRVIMKELNQYMCAAKCGNYWIILFGTDEWNRLTEKSAEVNYIGEGGSGMDDRYNGYIFW